MREHAKQTALNQQADEIWKGTIDGLTEAIRNRRVEQQKSLQTDVLQEYADRRAAQKELDDLTKQRDKLQQDIQNTIKQNRLTSDGKGGIKTGSIIEAPEKRVLDLQKQVADVNRKIALAEANVRGAQVPILDRQAEDRIDKVKAATDVYNAALGALHAQYVAGQITLKKYNSELDKLKANLKAVKDESKDSTTNRQSGRQVSFTQARDIAQSAGFQVNSTQRTFAEQKALWDKWVAQGRPKDNPVAPPGSSAHEGARGKWALDIQITDGVSPAKIRKVFADQGVSLTKVFKERGHFHVEGSRSEAASAERSAETAAAKKLSNDNAFAEASSRLDTELLQAKSQLAQSIDGQAEAAVAELQAAQAARKQAVLDDVTEGKLTAAQGKILSTKIDQIAFEQIRAVEIRRQVERLRQSDEAEQRQFEYRADDLRFADEMATTQSEHRQLQLDILDVVYQQKEAHLRALKAELELAGKIEEAAAIQAQIDRLPTDRAHDQVRVGKNTMSPLEAWAHDVPKTAAEINEALQSIEARGLESLANGITDVITGTKSLGAAFKDIARSIIGDILQMTVKMLIFRAISGLFGGGGISAPGGGSVPLNMATGPLASLPGGFGGFRASGGPVTAGTGYVVGERGQELFVPSSNGTIVPKAPRLSLSAANSNSPGNTTVIQMNGVITNDEFWHEVDRRNVQTVAQAAPAIVRASVTQTARVFGRPRLNGG
jgi:hypothetical protein